MATTCPLFSRLREVTVAMMEHLEKKEIEVTQILEQER